MMVNERKSRTEQKKRIMSKKAAYAVESALCIAMVLGIEFMFITSYSLPVVKNVVFLSALALGAAAPFLGRIKRMMLVVIAEVAVYAAIYFVFSKYIEKGFNKIFRILYVRMTSGRLPEGGETDKILTFWFCVNVSIYILLALLILLEGDVFRFALIVMPLLVLFYFPSEPAAWCELMFFGSMAVFLMTSFVKRRGSIERWARLAVRLSIPVAVLMAILGFTWKKSDYDAEKFPYKAGREIFSFATETASKLFQGRKTDSDFTPTGGLPPDDVGMDVNLEDIGRNLPSAETVMWVKSDERSGGFFLRGTAYSLYENGKWKVCEDENVDDRNFIVNSIFTLDSLDKITVRTAKPLDVLYVPYNTVALSAEAAIVGDAYIKNTANQTTYTFCCDSYGTRTVYDYDYENFVNEKCLYLPEELKSELLEIAERAGLTKVSEPELPEAVRDFIKQSAEYDLDVDSVPQGEDFILWFLKDSKKGYCMHFASACTAMLRALGVPARYVTGYAVIGKRVDFSDSWRRITGFNAHAWTEYFVSCVGWKPLDATGCVPGGPEVTAQMVSSSDVQELSESVPEFQNANPSGVPHEGVEKKGPVESKSDAPTVKQDEKAPAVKLIVLVLVSAAALWLANYFVCSLRNKKLQSGSTNTRVIENRRYIEKLCNALGLVADAGVNDIALKAKFSNRTISDDELRQVCDYRDELLTTLREENNLFRKLRYRFIRFLF